MSRIRDHKAGKPGKVATNEGHLHIKRGGWLTSDDLSNLYETCKLGRHGLPSEPVTKGVELSLEQARPLVRQLLDRWAEEFAAGSPHVMSDLRP